MDVDDQAGEPHSSELPDDDATVTQDPAESDGPSIIEAVVYGPLGLVLEARTLMPRLVQRGRNEVAMAKMVGQFAVRKGTEDLAAGALVGQERILGVLRGTRLFGASGSTTTTSPPSRGVNENAATTPPPSPSRVSATAVEEAAGIDPADLAIVGYDLLSASQVVPRLESLTATELELVARYEAGTRGRKTILAKVSQLQSAASPDQ